MKDPSLRPSCVWDFVVEKASFSIVKVAIFVLHMVNHPASNSLKQLIVILDIFQSDKCDYGLCRAVNVSGIITIIKEFCSTAL